jgi:Leucine-rich repeat (LRR) protein
MISLEEIDLCYTNITQIPSNAFQSINGAQNNLTSLVFDNSSIAEIGDNPFYHLYNLSYLSISGTNIDLIPKNAFNFEKESKKTLIFGLQWTKLNGTGIQLGSLENLKRPTDLFLGDSPKQTYFDEHIFRPFLDANDQNRILIDITHVSYIDCNDCRSYWLKKESKYYNRTNLWICSDGYKNLNDNTSFVNCEHFF